MVVRKAVRGSVPAHALPAFTPVPRKQPRHDGWTPERQKAFIEALADTGCVAIACRMVNMSQPSYYFLRRQPGAESFRSAADAAHTLGLQPVRDEAFDRAMHGQLVPVFVGGKLMGFRRKKNDRLLMFILRHYGQDATGRRTTINYFSTRATAGAGAAAPSGRQPTRSGALTSARDAGSGRPTTGEAESIDVTNSVRDGGSALAAAEASTTTVKTVITGNDAPSRLEADESAANLLNAFEGVALDAEAQAEIHRALAACAERRRALRTDWDTPRDEALARQAADPECDFIRVKPGSVDYLGELESGVGSDEFVPFNEGEPHWESIGEPKPQWFVEWEERQAEGLPAPDSIDPLRNGEGDRPKLEAKDGGGAISPSPQDPVPSLRTPAGEAAPAKAGGTYKKRKPKPPFTPLIPSGDEGAYEARKVEAVAEVEAERRQLAADEAERRRRKIGAFRDQSPG